MIGMTQADQTVMTIHQVKVRLTTIAAMKEPSYSHSYSSSSCGVSCFCLFAVHVLVFVSWYVLVLKVHQTNSSCDPLLTIRKTYIDCTQDYVVTRYPHFVRFHCIIQHVYVHY